MDRRSDGKALLAEADLQVPIAPGSRSPDFSASKFHATAGGYVWVQGAHHFRVVPERERQFQGGVGILEVVALRTMAEVVGVNGVENEVFQEGMIAGPLVCEAWVQDVPSSPDGATQAEHLTWAHPL